MGLTQHNLLGMTLKVRAVSFSGAGPVGPEEPHRKNAPRTFAGELVLFGHAFFLPCRKMDSNLHVRIDFQIARRNLNSNRTILSFLVETPCIHT